METQVIIQRLKKVSERSLQNYGDYSEIQLNFKPSSESWSIAQIFDHLIKINESYYPVIEALHQGTYTPPWYTSSSFLANYLGDFILKSVHPDRKKKIKTFPVWEPSYSNLPANILTRFIQHQETLIQLIQDSEPLIKAEAIICSPASRLIFYKLEKAFEIIVTHEERHLIQMTEIGDALKISAKAVNKN